jgi:hypothetical protein
MKRAIELEHPDLVMLTGDIVVSEDTRNAWLRRFESESGKI